jgi:predicted transcriptional regulator
VTFWMESKEVKRASFSSWPLLVVRLPRCGESVPLQTDFRVTPVQHVGNVGSSPPKHTVAYLWLNASRPSTCTVRYGPLTAWLQVPRLAIMEIHLTPEQEAELRELAIRKGRNADELAQEVLGFYLEHEARFSAAIKLGMDSLDRGESISHEEVGARIDRLFPS